MIETQAALEAALAADTLGATIAAGSTTTAIKLASVAGWRQGEVVHVTGAGATLANNLLVRPVLTVNAGALTLSVAALPIAPAAGDFVRAGISHWARPGGIYEVPRVGDLALEELLAETTDRHVLITVGIPLERPGLMALDEEEIRIRIYGRSPSWGKGCVARLRRLFHDRRASLSPAGRNAWKVRIDEASPQMRDDARSGILEWLVSGRVTTAPAFA